MPTGVYNREKTDAPVIDIPSRSGVRGRLDWLLEEYTTKAQALKITVAILDEDDRKQALKMAPKKFLQAINHRSSNNGHEAPTTRTAAGLTPKKTKQERADEIVAFLTQHPEATTTELAEGIGVKPNSILRLAPLVAKPSGHATSRKPIQWVLTGKAPRVAKTAITRKGHPRQQASASWHTEKPAISGKRLTLFLLEHLAEGKSRTTGEIMADLADAGSPLKSPRMLNGPMGASLVRSGFGKRVDDGYRITAKGMKKMVELRGELEALGKVKPGTYSA